MLFKTRFHDGLRRGDVRLTFRNWSRPQVRVGGRYRIGRHIELASRGRQALAVLEEGA